MRRRTMVRTGTTLAVLAVALLLVLTSCPGNRDGMPGRLATAKEETVSAARSGALALHLWSDHRSTGNLAAVQLSDARDQIAKAYGGVAVLKAEDPQDLRRQRLLTDTMTTLTSQLNAANAAVRAMSGAPDPHGLRRSLLDAADRLEAEYR